MRFSVPRATASESSLVGPPDPPVVVAEVYRLRLYVAAQSSRSVRAIDNLHRICREQLDASYVIEVIDLGLHPELARQDDVVAIPTVVLRHPRPVRRMVGDLADPERVMAGLALPRLPRSDVAVD